MEGREREPLPHPQARKIDKSLSIPECLDYAIQNEIMLISVGFSMKRCITGNLIANLVLHVESLQFNHTIFDHYICLIIFVNMVNRLYLL